MPGQGQVEQRRACPARLGTGLPCRANARLVKEGPKADQPSTVVAQGLQRPTAGPEQGWCKLRDEAAKPAQRQADSGGKATDLGLGPTVAKGLSVQGLPCRAKARWTKRHACPARRRAESSPALSREGGARGGRWPPPSIWQPWQSFVEEVSQTLAMFSEGQEEGPSARWFHLECKGPAPGESGLCQA